MMKIGKRRHFWSCHKIMSTLVLTNHQFIIFMSLRYHCLPCHPYISLRKWVCTCVLELVLGTDEGVVIVFNQSWLSNTELGWGKGRWIESKQQDSLAVGLFWKISSLLVSPWETEKLAHGQTFFRTRSIGSFSLSFLYLYLVLERWLSSFTFSFGPRFSF